jgi:hypothetical protein
LKQSAISAGRRFLGSFSNKLALGSIDTARLVKDFLVKDFLVKGFLTALRQRGSRSKATATPLFRHG